MENTKAELKVLVNNLRLSDTLDSQNCDSLADFLNPNRAQNVPKSISEQYNVGDLVLFDNHQGTGYIL